jgi:PAS domain S-box-containing protein
MTTPESTAAAHFGDFQQRLANLRAEYLARLPGQAAEIRSLAERIVAEPRALDLLRDLHRHAHRLAGSAGTFGIHGLGQAARRLEELLAACLGTGLAEDEAGTLRRAVADIEELARQSGHAAPGLARPLGRGVPAAARALLYLLQDDAPEAELIAARLGAAGYDVKIVARAADLADAGAPPQALLVDVVAPEGGDRSLALLADLRRMHPAVPVVAVSARDDMPARLAALRAGAVRYLAKPLDLERLISMLDGLTGRSEREPFRVLLVDDDPDLLAYGESVLRAAGMDVRSVMRPLETLGAARDMEPDLIVLDLYMPDVSGVELAALLRADDAFAHTPILFLSSEADRAKQLSAVEVGGDEFLVKPVAPAQLALAVTVRARRARHLRRLTGELGRALAEKEYGQFAVDQHAVVSVADAAGNIVYANRKFEELSGYSAAELMGRNHRLLKSGVHPDSFYREMWQTISTGRVWHGTLCNRRKDGALYWVESTIVPFLDEAGVPCQYVSVRTDVTALKQAQEAAARSEERLRRSQAYANIGTWDWNIQTGELYWSDRIGPLFGYAEGQLDTTYENFINAVHPEDRQAVLDAVDACVERGEKYEIEHRCIWPDGSVRWMLERGDVVRDAAGRPLHMLGVVQDVTPRKLAELALRESRGRLEEAQRIARIGNWEANLATGELHWSAQIYHIFGYDPASFTPSVEAFYAAVHPDDMDKLRASEQRARATGVHDVVHRIVRPDGEVRWVRELAELQLGADGAPLRLAGTVQDVTALKQTELELIRAKEEAERASRAKSEFLANVSHELRTPLNAILGFAQLLEMDLGLPAEHRQSTEEILKAGHHLLELINDVLDLERVEAGRIELALEPVACDGLLAECGRLVDRLARERGITLEVRPASVVVRADRVRLKQALLNLLSNAIKYNSAGGRVTLDASPAGDLVRLCVSDTGPGISAARQTQLFQPFNRLGAEFSGIEGTGIGLVISRRLVEMMGGHIGVESAPGAGSTFWIELPCAADRIDRAPMSPAAACQAVVSDPAPQSVVLYIEDNPANLQLMRQLFAHRRRLRLLTAATAALGLELAATHRPDLILLDINLPGLDGYEVLRRLRALPVTADIPVAAVTANAMPQDIERGRAAGFSAYLTKPLDVAGVFEAVDRLLAAGRRGAN